MTTLMTQPTNDLDGEVGQIPCATQELNALILPIQEYYKQRVSAIKARIRIDNQAAALVRRYLGYQISMDENETKRINALAGKIVKAVRDDKPVPEGHEETASSCYLFIKAAGEARLPFILHEKHVEKKMVKLVVQLPVYSWVESIKGLGAVGLGVYVGECGDLSNYSGPAKVWKRIGLAVMEGKRQGNPGKNATADDWIDHGYCKRRRAASWTIASSLLKADNKYRDLYLARKIVEFHKATDKGFIVSTKNKATADRWVENNLPRPEVVKTPDPDIHWEAAKCNAWAARYAEKRMIKDLWCAWRDAV